LGKTALADKLHQPLGDRRESNDFTLWLVMDSLVAAMDGAATCAGRALILIVHSSDTCYIVF
jgi:hypothetical protein